MASFYSVVDGMADNDYLDDSVIRIFPLKELRTVREEFSGGEIATFLQPENAFVIADWSVAAHFYASDLASPGCPVFIVADSPIRVATGFSKFVRKVLEDDSALFDGEDAA